MPRTKQKSKTRLCTYCGRLHPKGKKQKERAREQGWRGCSDIRAQRGQASESNVKQERRFTVDEQANRAAKNAIRRAHNDEQKVANQKATHAERRRNANIPPAERLAILDARLGEGVGAVRERARLQEKIEKLNAKKKKPKGTKNRSNKQNKRSSSKRSASR